MIITVTKRDSGLLANIYRAMHYYAPDDYRFPPEWYITNQHVVPQLKNDDDTTQMDVTVQDYQSMLTMIRDYDEVPDENTVEQKLDTQPLLRWLAAYTLPAAVEEADREDSLA